MTDGTRRFHVDSNVVLRYLTADPLDMAEKARALVLSARNQRVLLVVEEIVVAETAWVLRSFYKRSPQEISGALMQFLLDESVDCPDKGVALQALQLYAQSGVKFGDALLAAHMADEGASDIFSFDEHFDRIPGIHRLMPGG